jgi:hypothetical protein
MVSAERHVPLTTHLFRRTAVSRQRRRVRRAQQPVVDFRETCAGKALTAASWPPYYVANYDFAGAGEAGLKDARDEDRKGYGAADGHRTSDEDPMCARTTCATDRTYPFTEHFYLLLTGKRPRRRWRRRCDVVATPSMDSCRACRRAV